MRLVELLESANVKFVVDPAYSFYYDDDYVQRDYQLVNVNVEPFDAKWKYSDLYIAPGGIGGITGRYQRFDDFVKSGIPVHASVVSIDNTGDISFTNGRHRFAWFRDHGYKSIPVAMDKISINRARKFGYI